MVEMRAFTIAAIIAVLTVPAHAQNLNLMGGTGAAASLGKKATSK
jgi:hypothetical protein